MYLISVHQKRIADIIFLLNYPLFAFIYADNLKSADRLMIRDTTIDASSLIILNQRYYLGSYLQVLVSHSVLIVIFSKALTYYLLNYCYLLR